MCGFRFAALVGIMASLTQPTLATYSAGKGGQINFYTDASCTKYTGEADCWWDKTPHVGRTVPGGQDADCFSLNIPGNSLSINTAELWSEEGSTTSGQCYLYDGYGCTGNSVSSTYTPGKGQCFASRSDAGWLWKSAWCTTF